MRLDGVRHVGLTVTDLDQSVGWYDRVLGFREVFREEHPDRTAAIVRNGSVIVGLVRFTSAAQDTFSPRRVGLDHLCFTVEDREDLESWVRHLDRCAVRHSGIAEMTTGPIVNFTDPDGIAMSLAPPPRTAGADDGKNQT